MCDRSNVTPIMSGANGARGERRGRLRLAGWATVAFVLVALAVPWFLWRDATVLAGLPLWIWWHVGWMALASVVFYVFTKRAWESASFGLRPVTAGRTRPRTRPVPR